MTMAALRIAKERLGLDSVRLSVYKDNFSAITVYKRAGFLISGEILDSKGNPMINMKIQL